MSDKERLIDLASLQARAFKMQESEKNRASYTSKNARIFDVAVSRMKAKFARWMYRMKKSSYEKKWGEINDK